MFPFIRYEIGDAGVMSDRASCQCGLKLPILDRVEVCDSKGIDAYQIVQETINKLTLKIVRNDKFNSAVENNMLTGFRKLAGQDVKISFDYVDDIPVPLSGKRRFVISHVSPSLL